MVQVFISHAHRDRAVAQALGESLSRSGVQTWRAPSVYYGADSAYRDDVERGLRESALVLVLWSASASDSAYVRREIGRAPPGTQVVPVLLDDTPLPPELARIQALDLRGWDGDPADARAGAVVAALRRAALAATSVLLGSPASAPPRGETAVGAAAPQRPPPTTAPQHPPAATAAPARRSTTRAIAGVLGDLASAGLALGGWLWSRVRPEARPPEPVLLAASAPRRVAGGAPFSAALVAYVEAARAQALQHLAELGEACDRRVADLAASAWRIGAPVTVRLAADGAEVSPAEIRFEWNGRENLAAFSVRAPPDARGGALVLQFIVELAGVATVSVPMHVQVGATADARAQRTDATLPRSAFASYASADVQTVAQKLSALARWAPGLDLFQDCLDLRPGEGFKPQLAAQIDARDVFLLFWSRRAAGSPWVRWELDTALARKNAEAILPMPLEDPRIAPPPQQIADRHLRDRFLLAGYALERIDEVARSGAR